jgi:hypothetical protein
LMYNMYDVIGDDQSLNLMRHRFLIFLKPQPV